MNPHQHKAAPLFLPEINGTRAPNPEHWTYSEAVHYHDGPKAHVMFQVHTHRGPLNICPARAVYLRNGKPYGRSVLMKQDEADAIWAVFLKKMRTLTYEETTDVLSALKFAKALSK